MNSRVLLAFLCIASFSTGCIIVDDDHPNHPNPPRNPGDVTFIWTLDGLRCDEARDVYGVNIRIPGEALHNDGEYACSTAGVDGITLHDFAPGSYSFEIEAVDFRGVVLFAGSGTFVIDGDRRVNIDLAPVGNPTSYAYLSWTLPGGMSCAQAGVALVEIIIPELGPTEVPCQEGQIQPGKKTPALSPGTHNISFTALASDGAPLYYYRGQIVTEAFRPRSFDFQLVDGGASIAWRFSDGSITFDCGQGGTSATMQVRVDFQDTVTGEWLYEAAGGDWHPCSTKPIIYRHLPPGTYKLALYAKTAGGVEYFSNPSIPNLRIDANVYPTANQALEVVLYRR
jgi:hypothetical protein